MISIEPWVVGVLSVALTLFVLMTTFVILEWRERYKLSKEVRKMLTNVDISSLPEIDAKKITPGSIETNKLQKRRIMDEEEEIWETILDDEEKW